MYGQFDYDILTVSCLTWKLQDLKERLLKDDGVSLLKSGPNFFLSNRTKIESPETRG